MQFLNITPANRSEDQPLRPIGVKNTSQPAQTSPMSEYSLLCTPIGKAGDLNTPDYSATQGHEKKFFFEASVYSRLGQFHAEYSAFTQGNIYQATLLSEVFI